MTRTIGSLIGAALFTATVVAVGVQQSSSSNLPPCEVEDQTTACRWDAATSGNGRGMSFTVSNPDGYEYAVTYDEGPTRILHGHDGRVTIQTQGREVHCATGEWAQPYADVDGHTEWTCEAP